MAYNYDMRHKFATCSVDGCCKPHSSHTLCKTHYSQARRGKRDMPPMIRDLPPRTCSMDNCNGVVKSRNLCNSHYYRWLRRNQKRRCSLDDCDKPHRAHGLCITHLRRYQKTGGYGKALLYKSGPTTYAAAHARVSSLWGAAKLYPCIGCGREAQEWAYDGTDLTQMMGSCDGSGNSFYSSWPEFYMPMCKSCHRKLDMGLASAQLVEYRLLLAIVGGDDAAASVRDMVERLRS